MELYLSSIVVTGVDHETCCEASFVFELFKEELFYFGFPFFFRKNLFAHHRTTEVNS